MKGGTGGHGGTIQKKAGNTRNKAAVGSAGPQCVKSNHGPGGGGP